MLYHMMLPVTLRHTLLELGRRTSLKRYGLWQKNERGRQDGSTGDRWR